MHQRGRPVPVVDAVVEVRGLRTQIGRNQFAEVVGADEGREVALDRVAFPLTPCADSAATGPVHVHPAVLVKGVEVVSESARTWSFASVIRSGQS